MSKNNSRRGSSIPPPGDRESDTERELIRVAISVLVLLFALCEAMLGAGISIATTVDYPWDWQALGAVIFLTGAAQFMYVLRREEKNDKHGQ